MKKKIIIAVNSTFNLINHRVGLINGLLDGGYEVVAISPTDEFASRIKELDCHHVPLQMERKGTNIGQDLLLFWRYRTVLRQYMPDIYLGFTAKPNIYGSLAAQSLGIPVINNISGLGTVFGAMSSTLVGNLLARLLKLLYWFSLLRSDKIFFQNKYSDIRERSGRDGKPFLIITRETTFRNQNDAVLCITRASTIRR